MDETGKDQDISDEYKDAKEGLVFLKFCKKFDRDKEYQATIRNLYRKSTDVVHTTRLVFQRDFELELDSVSAERMRRWVYAHFTKKSSRKPFPSELKGRLEKKQNGLCAICHQKLNADESANHVDHIIAWKYVGDELDDNYQVLCEGCNKRKSDSPTFGFRYRIKLT